MYTGEVNWSNLTNPYSDENLQVTRSFKPKTPEEKMIKYFGADFSKTLDNTNIYNTNVIKNLFNV